MAASPLVDSHVSEQTVSLAVKSLLAHTLKARKALEEGDLLPPKEDHVWLVVTTKRMPKSSKVKPIKIPLAHPLIDPRETSICLLTKDPQREYKDLLTEKNITFISRVVGVTKLKGKHKPFEARRQLLKDHGMFLADQRIVPLLPQLLGKMFFEAKKQPVPVDMTRNDLKAELVRAISSTYMHQNAGTCVSIKLSALSHTPDQIIANFVSALPAIVKNVEGGWDNVLSLSVKTGRSVSLPVWSCDLNERWTVSSLDAADKEAKEIKTKGQGKKRKATETDKDAEEKAESVVAESEGSEEPKRKKKKSTFSVEPLVDLSAGEQDSTHPTPLVASLASKPKKAKKKSTAEIDAEPGLNADQSATNVAAGAEEGTTAGTKVGSKPKKAKKATPAPASDDGADTIPLVSTLSTKKRKSEAGSAAASSIVLDGPGPSSSTKAAAMTKDGPAKEGRKKKAKEAKASSASVSAAATKEVDTPKVAKKPKSAATSEANDEPPAKKKKGPLVLAAASKTEKAAKSRTKGTGAKASILGRKKVV